MDAASVVGNSIRWYGLKERVAYPSHSGRSPRGAFAENTMAYRRRMTFTWEKTIGLSSQRHKQREIIK